MQLSAARFLLELFLNDTNERRLRHSKTRVGLFTDACYIESMSGSFRALPAVYAVLVSSLLLSANNVFCQNGTWRTVTHAEKTCAMFGSCGTKDGSITPCAMNKPAEHINASLAAKFAQYCPYLWNDIAEERLACCNEEGLDDVYQSMAQSFNLIGGCPACLNNFANLWCTIRCSPDQSMFVDVFSAHENTDLNRMAVDEVHFYLSDAFKRTLFDSCKEVKYSLVNLPFLSFMGNPSDADELLEFLGTSADDGGYAPYTLKFVSEETVPDGMTVYDKELPNCGSPGYECSCADCSAADYCATYALEEEEEESNSGIRYYEIAIAVVAVLALILVQWSIYYGPFERSMRDIDFPDGTSQNSYEPLSDGNEFRAVLLEDESVVYPAMESWLRDRFRRLGHFIVWRPYSVIAVSLVAIGLVCMGNLNCRLETSPQSLWTPKGSRTEREQRKYREAFGAFYRVENHIISSTPSTPSPHTSVNHLPSIVTADNLNLTFRLQELVDQIEGRYSDGNQSFVVRLEDVCYKPLEVCAIQSVLQYWQMDRAAWQASCEEADDKDACVRFGADRCFQHWTTDCRSAFESPMDPNLVLGGFPMDDSFDSYVNDSTAFVVTYLLDSSEEKRSAAMAWEEAFLEASKTYLTDLAKEAHLQLTYSAERSTEDEVDRETYMDAPTVVISYVVMFIYIACSLTFLTKRHSGVSDSIWVRSHVILALEGIGIVILSLLGAIGLVSLLELKVSMIVLEVLPFLVLAVGVDNMFILANELRSLDPGLPLYLRLGSAMAEVGPSITCAAASEALAFGLAAIAPIPAVRNFSLSACFAILLDFVLQCTLFAALLVLDTIRRENNRTDCVPCLRVHEDPLSDGAEYIVWERGTPPQEIQLPIPENAFQRFISDNYVPFLLAAYRKWIRSAILSLTVILFAVSCVLTGRMEMGMKEQVAFPQDSYLQDFYTDGLPLMRAGAPVMFVVENMNVSNASDHPDEICGIAGCLPDSLVSRIDLAARAHVAHLAAPVTSWIDEFLMWIQSPSCCRRRGNTTEHCPYEDTDPACIPCTVHITSDTPLYQEYLPRFMESTPGEICPRGGHGTYEDYIQHAKHNSSDIVGLDHEVIRASAFRTYYSTLVSQNDYIEALKDTHEFADALKESLGLEIYVYSLFHIYFQQYLDLIPIAAVMISVAVGAIFLVCWVFLSSFRAAIIMMLCVVMIVVDIVGVSYLAEVKLNGVSVVNLTMSVGIAVEFCTHVAHAFMTMPGSRVGRVAAAVQGVGISVISGITLTKFLGVIVLASATTKLFRIYFFRMYMALVLLGAWHGLVVLPILLALFGTPPPTKQSRRGSNDRPRSQTDEAPYISMSK